jgi:OPA family sugar phosphate sensor protein UhpC-like MFS transporter
MLKLKKDIANIEAGEIIGMTAITGIIGTAISGLISDKYFKGSRNIPALTAGLLNIISIAIFLFYPEASFLDGCISHAHSWFCYRYSDYIFRWF